MSRYPRYDILFEPVKIGPKTARNRFYQVPHCNGMGHRYPSSLAAMRGVKAEGGWAVVSTEEVEIHPSTDVTPYNEGRLWDDRDMPYHKHVVDAIHAHNSLAAIELTHSGHHAYNGYSREPALGVVDEPIVDPLPVYARAMDRSDIKAFRKWHRDAALRARDCGYDLIYIYCGHGLDVRQQFLSRRFNTRSDEYGGSLENRVRLLRETMEDTLEAVGHDCAVPIRFAVDEMMGEDGLTCENEGRDVVEMLAEMPDLWDVNVSDWDNDSLTSRFGDSGFQDAFTGFVKQVTSKPVVGVGRYTSPDAMVSLIKRGALDMIGAARPSIADPFLPKKIEEGRIEDIRECIGCNICVTGDMTAVPIRCTQNPTMGEEWRRDWHPERIAAKGSDANVLVIGGGPAGLEAARALGQRGYETVLAEAGASLGGRVNRESGLPGLTQWGRVRDYREYQIQQMGAVETYLESRLSVDDVLGFGARHIAVATGASWRRDTIGRTHKYSLPGLNEARVFCPDDIMDGVQLEGTALVYDDEHFYMGGLVAEALVKQGVAVTLVTTASEVSSFTHNTLEQHRIQKTLLEMGVEIVTTHSLSSLSAGHVRIACGYTGREKEIAAENVVLVTAMTPSATLYKELQARQEDWGDAGIQSVTAIGDCLAPGTIAAAVWSGHRYARTLDAPEQEGVWFKREIVGV